MGLLQKKQFIYKIGTIEEHPYFVYNSCFAAALFSWFWKVFAWQSGRSYRCQIYYSGG